MGGASFERGVAGGGGASRAGKRPSSREGAESQGSGVMRSGGRGSKQAGRLTTGYREEALMSGREEEDGREEVSFLLEGGGGV